ncbi:MAG: hypothetical protein OXF99_05720 [bacterium]|nr:hypothetical protein [bacterium]
MARYQDCDPEVCGIDAAEPSLSAPLAVWGRWLMNQSLDRAEAMAVGPEPVAGQLQIHRGVRALARPRRCGRIYLGAGAARGGARRVVLGWSGLGWAG